jgi:cytoskeleton protein RodZ
LPSFGQKLKLEREKRAITLEQISSSTKIGLHMLQALEEENFNRLPGGIFNKGFVRAYARHVGLDEDQAITDYLKASGQDEVIKPESDMEGQKVLDAPPERSAEWQIPWSSFAAVLLLLALVLWLWSRQHKNETHSQTAAPVSSEKIANSSSPITNALSSDSLSKDGIVNPAQPPLQTAKVPSAIVKNASTTESALRSTTPSGQFTVVILAREDSWLSVIADGKTVFEDTLTAENQHAIHAQKEVVIRAGNIGALDFVFNGQKLSSQGDYGEVKTLTFRSDGLHPNAPSPRVAQ